MDMAVILTRILELCIGLLAIVNFKWQSRGGSKLSEKDWLAEVEKKEREIVKLKIEVKVWKKHYHDATSTHV